MTRRLLVVEDDPANARLICLMCERSGYEVWHEPNGHAALVWLAAHPVDLVLMDIELPELDGLSAVRALRANPATAAMRVIVVTAHAFPDQLARIRECGADGLLIKPFTHLELGQALAQVLGY